MLAEPLAYTNRSLGSNITMEQALIRIDQAEAFIHESIRAIAPCRIPLALCAGRVLRERVIATRQQPPFDRVMMDGIAINSADFIAGIREFLIIGTQAAGQTPLQLSGSASCIEIMTGAVLPIDCDAVIPVERISIIDGRATLEQGLEVSSGQHIHRQGSDYLAGKVLLNSGVLIRAPEVAVIASAGLAEVLVSPELSAGIISLGDELIQPGEPISAHQIHRSNDLAVAASLVNRGDLNAHCFPVADDPEKVAVQIEKVLAIDDFLVLCGGVSKGKFDFVPGLLTDLGVRRVFHGIAQRPGKPFWFGIASNGKPVFALPGNPVSVLACVARYLLPAVDQLRGLTRQEVKKYPLAEAVESPSSKGWLLAVQLVLGDRGELMAAPRVTNTSGDFAGLAGTDGIIELPGDLPHFPAGYMADFYSWDGVL